MSALSRHNTAERACESPMRMSPHAFDALSKILGRTIARGLQHRTASHPVPLHETPQTDNQDTRENACPLPYEWAARHLLAKMRVEAN